MISIYGGRGYDKTESVGQLSVSGVSRVDVPEGWTGRKRFLYMSEFVYVTSGEICMSLGGNAFSIGKNQCIVCPVYARVEEMRTSGAKCSFYVIEHTASDVGVLGYFENRVRSVSGGTTFAEEFLKRIHSTYIREPGPNPMLDTMFYSLVCELRDRADTAQRTDLPIREIIDYIDSHVGEPIDASAVCRRFGYNTDYMSKVFRAGCGMSIKQYINAVKLQTAKRLLTSSHMTVARVGAAVGFDDVTLFYKFFRYHEGVTPSEYRKIYS